MRIRVHFVGLIVICCALAEALFAQGAQLEGISRRITETGLPSLLADIQAGKVVWPLLDSEKANAAFETSRARLASAYIGGLRELAETRPDRNPADLQRFVLICAPLSAELERSGGYTNLILSDATHRLRLAALVSFLESSRDYRTADTMFRSGGSPYTRETLLSVFVERSVAATRMKMLDEVSEDKLLVELTKELGVSLGDLFLGDRSSGALLRTKNLPVALGRVTETMLLYEMAFPAMIAFVSRGGMTSELSVADVRPFNQRLGDLRARFSFPFFNIRMVRVTDLLSLLDGGRSFPTLPAFARIALE